MCDVDESYERLVFFLLFACLFKNFYDYYVNVCGTITFNNVGLVSKDPSFLTSKTSELTPRFTKGKRTSFDVFIDTFLLQKYCLKWR